MNRDDIGKGVNMQVGKAFEATNGLGLSPVGAAAPQQARWATITPAMATELLANAGGNFRPLNQRRVVRIAETVSACGWRHDGNSIKLNLRGEVVDGQHRLAAIARLGLTVQSWIITGVSDYDTHTEGTDMPKTFAQYLKKRGERRYKDLAAAARHVWLWERGFIQRHGTQYTANTAELIMTLERHPGLRDSVVKSESTRLFCTIAHVAALHYIAASHGLRSEADRFVELLATGAGLTENDPIYRLRDRMASAKARGEHMTTTERLALLIVVWNYWLQGREVQRLRWVGVGPSAQPFPTLATSRDGAADSEGANG